MQFLPFLWPNSALSTSVLLQVAGFLSSHIFHVVLCSVIAKSACPGRISLDDTLRYEKRSEIDIWCKSKLCLKDGGELVFSKN